MIIPLVKPIVKFILGLFDSGGLGSKPTNRGPTGLFRVHPCFTYLHNPFQVYRPSNHSIYDKKNRGPLNHSIIFPQTLRPSNPSIYYRWLNLKGYAVCDGVTENIGILDNILLIVSVLGIFILSYIALKILNFKHKKD